MAMLYLPSISFDCSLLHFIQIRYVFHISIEKYVAKDSNIVKNIVSFKFLVDTIPHELIDFNAVYSIAN